MKSRQLFGIFAFLCIALISLSCSSSDGDSKTKVKYVLHCDTNIVTNIEYKKADGTTETLTTEQGPDWEKTIKVDKPFDANLVVHFNNTAPNQSTFFLLIYVGDATDPSGYTPGVVPPNASYTGATSVNIPE